LNLEIIIPISANFEQNENNLLRTTDPYKAGYQQEFQAFEDKVLRILKNHNGELIYCNYLNIPLSFSRTKTK